MRRISLIEFIKNVFLLTLINPWAIVMNRYTNLLILGIQNDCNTLLSQITSAVGLPIIAV